MTTSQNDIHTCHADCQNPICIAVREAVAAEREACIKLCEDAYLSQKTALFAAGLIRARGQ